MNTRIVPRLNFGKKIIMAFARMTAVAAPIGVGIFNEPSVRAQTLAAREFEVASISLCDNGNPRPVSGNSSPGRLRVECTTLGTLPDSFPGILQQAYGLFANGRKNPLWSIPKIEGGPAWINSERYQINAKAEGEAGPEMMMGPMMQALLEDRFNLKLHRETREAPVYALTVAKGGLKLQPFREGSCTPSYDTLRVSEQPPVCKARVSSKRQNLLTIDGQGMTLDEFSGLVLTASAFGFKLDRPLVNKTGVTGRFDFHLEFAIDDVQGVSSSGAAGPSIFTAVQQQLGLKLEATKGPAEFLVIDHVEKPSEN
jgi:uncharacterized protein (TIGR03435 family)